MRELSAELSAVPSPLPLPELWPAGFILSCCHCPWAGRGVGRGGKALVRSGGSCSIPQDVAKEPEPGSAGARVRGCGAACQGVWTRAARVQRASTPPVSLVTSLLGAGI